MTDVVIDEIELWRNRPVEEVYATDSLFDVELSAVIISARLAIGELFRSGPVGTLAEQADFAPFTVRANVEGRPSITIPVIVQQEQSAATARRHAHWSTWVRSAAIGSRGRCGMCCRWILAAGDCHSSTRTNDERTAVGDAALYFALGWAASGHGPTAAGLVRSAIALVVAVVLAIVSGVIGAPLALLIVSALIIGTNDAFYLPSAGARSPAGRGVPVAAAGEGRRNAGHPDAIPWQAMPASVRCAPGRDRPSPTAWSPPRSGRSA